MCGGCRVGDEISFKAHFNIKIKLEKDLLVEIVDINLYMLLCVSIRCHSNISNWDIIEERDVAPW